MRITSRSIHTEENQGKITFETAGTTRLTFTGEGHAIFASSATASAVYSWQWWAAP